MGSFEFTGNVISFVVSEDGKKLAIWYPDEPADRLSMAHLEASTMFKLLQGQFSAAVRAAAGKPPIVRVTTENPSPVVEATPVVEDSSVEEVSHAMKTPHDVVSSAGPIGPSDARVQQIRNESENVVTYVDNNSETQVVGRGEFKRTISKAAHGRGVVTREVVQDGELVDKGVVEQIRAHDGQVQSSIRQMPVRAGSSMNRRPNAAPPQPGAPAMRTVPAVMARPTHPVPNVQSIPNRQGPPNRAQPTRPAKVPQPVRPSFTRSFDRQTKGK